MEVTVLVDVYICKLRLKACSEDHIRQEMLKIALFCLPCHGYVTKFSARSHSAHFQKVTNPNRKP